MQSGAMLRLAGLSAAARSPTLGDRGLPCADPKITRDGWAGPVPRRGKGCESRGREP